MPVARGEARAGGRCRDRARGRLGPWRFPSSQAVAPSATSEGHPCCIISCPSSVVPWTLGTPQPPAFSYLFTAPSHPQTRQLSRDVSYSSSVTQPPAFPIFPFFLDLILQDAFFDYPRHIPPFLSLPVPSCPLFTCPLKALPLWFSAPTPQSLLPRFWISSRTADTIS